MQGAPPPPQAPPPPLPQAPPPRAAASSPIACVALIGQQNQPLLLRVLGPPAPASAAATASATAAELEAEQQLRFSYVAHCALDALEERVLLGRRAAAAAGGGAASAAADPSAGAYLGLLYPSEEHRVYGYCSATHLKVVLVVAPLLAPGAGGGGGGGGGAAAAAAAAAAFPPPSSASASAAATAAPAWPRDAPLARLCRRLHAVYADAASGPFFVPGAPLGDDARVLKGVDAALEEFSAVVAAGG